MPVCLFCLSQGSFKTVEHVIPESLGNDDLILRGEVCDGCQNYFGKEIERFVLGKTPLAFWRTFLGVRTKKGRLPSVDLSQPSRRKGVLPTNHPIHDNSIGFTAHEDGSTSVDIDDSKIVREILDGSRSTFRFVLTPKALHMLARFLLKVGLELMCLSDAAVARTPTFDDARSYSRYGKGDLSWGLFHFTSRTISQLIQQNSDKDGPFEEVQLYEYQLLSVDEYILICLGIGTDSWIVSLTHRYPDQRIRSGFPGQDLQLMSA